MKINKQFVQEVANGKYSDYDSHGEMQRAAQRILDEKVVSKFQKFCFSVYGKEMPDNVMDVFDAFVDFASHGAEVRLEIPEGYCPSLVQIFGMTLTESMAKLHYWLMDNWAAVECDVLERIEFTVKGIKGRFKINMAANHYVFVKGRGNEKDFLEWCRVA